MHASRKNSATSTGWRILLALLVLALQGCAGSNFVRPLPGSIIVGKTTQQEVEQQLGKPYQTGTVLKDGKSLQTATYAFAKVGGEALHAGITPARSQGFYFLNGLLVGSEFTSSFKADGTEFDDTKVALIEKGKSTRQDIETLFGPPGGEYLPPLTTDGADRAWVYLYSQAKGSAFNLRVLNKSLVVSFDASGLVTDVKFTSQGNRD